MPFRIPVFRQLDVRGAVRILHARAEGQCAAIRGHVDAKRGDASIGTNLHGAVRPQLRVDGAGDCGFVPYAKAFAPERIIA